MIELKNDHLVFSFPEIHPEASLEIEFQRTLRIPDDGEDYPLPPGLGNFSIRHVDDHAGCLPQTWLERGGVMLPMYQSEAMWINFSSRQIPGHGAQYPFAVKIAAGKINAVTGAPWTDALRADPQDYLVVPDQPWLDGYCVEKGFIRQFVAMPLGDGYSPEAQITGSEETGGLQVSVYPMKRKAFEKRYPKIDEREYPQMMQETLMFSIQSCESPMALGMGGRMRQKIYEDEFDFSDWDRDTSSRCFVHLANSNTWRAITGKTPPTLPPTAKDYSRRGLPWFEYYSENRAVSGSGVLEGLDSVNTLGKKKRKKPLPENDSANPEKIVKILKKKTPYQVREW
ncbi:hypothetical protein [Halomonas sp.]|uniref:hypothetical protein n=1 Tax=Halomonas sp. TaxID=1486246 RepID=UPI0025C0AB3C|nr:hypothetical protein [Halomonas sp.]